MTDSDNEVYDKIPQIFKDYALIFWDDYTYLDLRFVNKRQILNSIAFEICDLCETLDEVTKDDVLNFETLIFTNRTIQQEIDIYAKDICADLCVIEIKYLDPYEYDKIHRFVKENLENIIKNHYTR
jgi:hypothetical protein